MEFKELIDARYSVRKYKNGEIPDSDIVKMVEAAGKAPSGKNFQNWHYVAIKDAKMKEAMKKAVEDKVAKIGAGLDGEKQEKFLKMARFATFFTDAPVVFAIYADKYTPEGLKELQSAGMPEEDADKMLYADPALQCIGAGVEHLILAAFDMGYGACWMTSTNHSIKELEEVIGFEKDKYQLVALIPVGKIEGERKSPPKKEATEILTII